VVLLVDDQPIVAEAIRRMVADQPDIELAVCNSAAKALPKARELRPTVILQDLVMPDVDGFTLVRFFRADPQTSAIPIIVLSSKEDPRDKSRAFEIGASDYLVKIPDRVELVARVRAHSRSFLAQRERDEAYRALEVLKGELEIKNQELARISMQDGLTGLANRRRFDEVLDRECRRAIREETHLSLLMIDVDFFKKYNDSYGHQAGDECLRQVAAAVGATARRPGDLAARYGGEEFSVILPNTPEEGASNVADKIREGIAALNLPHMASTVASRVTLSLGIATTRAGGNAGENASPKVLVERADAALYAAKRAGRDGWRMWQAPHAGGPEDPAEAGARSPAELRSGSDPKT
jgi:two-component system chemotaxis family response regulator WspR